MFGRYIDICNRPKYVANPLSSKCNRNNMLDENLIATLEQSLRQTRNAQNRLIARLRESENEVDMLRMEIQALENSAAQTEKAIDSLLVNMRSSASSRDLGRSLRIDDDVDS